MRIHRRRPLFELVLVLVMVAIMAAAPAQSIGLGGILSLGMWAAEFFREQHERVEYHEAAVQLRVMVPEQHRRAADPYRIDAEFVSTEPSASGFTYTIVREDDPRQGLWPTKARYFTEDSGYEVEWAQLKRGSQLIGKRISGEELRKNRYIDFDLPSDLGYGQAGEERGMAEKFSVVYHIPGNKEERVVGYFFVRAISFSDLYALYLAETQMGRRLGETKRQLHPERTAHVIVNVDPRLGLVNLSVLDSVGAEQGARPGDESTYAFSEKVAGRQTINVKPGQVWVGLDTPFDLFPQPDPKGFYYLVSGQEATPPVINIVPLGGDKR